jgi:hypothetical protein
MLNPPSSSAEEVKLIVTYTRGSSALRSDEAWKAMKQIFESIIELSDTVHKLSDAGSGDKHDTIVVDDDYVDISGIKLKRNDREPSAKNLMSVASYWQWTGRFNRPYSFYFSGCAQVF